MKRVSVVFMVMGMLAAVLSSCSQPSSSKEETTEITKIVHQFEQAYFQTNYEEEKKYLYDPNEFTVHKNDKKREVKLEYEKMCFKVYYIDDLKQYMVFSTFDTPTGSRTITEGFLLRKKDGEYKIDMKQSRYLKETSVPDKAKETLTSINCE